MILLFKKILMKKIEEKVKNGNSKILRRNYKKI